MNAEHTWWLDDQEGVVTIHGPGGLTIEVGTSRPTWYTSLERLAEQDGSLLGVRLAEGHSLDLWGERQGRELRWRLYVGTDVSWPLPEAFVHELMQWARLAQ
jgi:hypothetical protein